MLPTLSLSLNVFSLLLLIEFYCWSLTGPFAPDHWMLYLSIFLSSFLLMEICSWLHLMIIMDIQLNFIPQILLTTVHFLTLFFLSYFCLTGPFNCVSLHESLLLLWYNPLCLTGLKAPANYLTHAYLSKHTRTLGMCNSKSNHASMR